MCHRSAAPQWPDPALRLRSPRGESRRALTRSRTSWTPGQMLPTAARPRGVDRPISAPEGELTVDPARLDSVALPEIAGAEVPQEPLPLDAHATRARQVGRYFRST